MKKTLKFFAILLCILLVLQTAQIGVFAVAPEALQASAGPEGEDVYAPEEYEMESEPSELTWDETPEDEAQPETEPEILGELEAERAADAKTFKLSDGTKRVVVYPQDVHFADGTGKFVEYDNRLREADDGEGTFFVPTATDTGLRISRETNENTLAHLEKDGYEIEWNYEGIEARTGKTQSPDPDGDPTSLETAVSELRFTDVFPQTDLQMILSGNLLKENLILQTPDAPASFRIHYRTARLKPLLCEDKRTVLFLSDGNETEYVLCAPFMTDAAGAASAQLTFTLEECGENEFVVALTADADWLADPARKFPVEIDPLLKTSQTGGGATSAFVSSRQPTNTYGQGGNNYEGSLYVGNFGGYYNQTHSFLRFNLPALSPGDRVVDAQMFTYLAYCYPNITVNLRKVSASWSQSTVNWNNQPAYSSEICEYKDLTTAESESAFSAYRDGHWISWDVTTLVDGWYTDPATNYGVALTSPAETEGDANGARFYSTGYTSYTSVRPLVYVSYRSMRGYEDYYSYESVSAGRGGTADVNVYNGNLVATQPVTVSNGGLLLPVNVSLIYNSDASLAELGRSGYGWRTNYNLWIKKYDPAWASGADANIAKYKYYFEDCDGTRHYFFFASGATDGVDEDGLGFTLHVNDAVSEGSEGIRYTITDKQKKKIEFDGRGSLRYIKDTYNNTVTVSYQHSDAYGYRISSVKDGANRTYSFTYLPDDQYPGNWRYINKITDPAGRVTTFSYSNGKLTSLKYQDNTLTSFTYNSENRLTKITAADGLVTDISYDGSVLRRVTSLQNSGGSLTGAAYAFTYKKNATTVLDHLGKTYTYQFDTYGHNTGIVSMDSGEAVSMTFENGNSSSPKANKQKTASRTQTSVKNYVSNPSFVSSLSGFNVAKQNSAGSGTVTWDGSLGNFANGAVKISKPDAATGYLYARQNVTGLPAGFYTASAFVNTNGTTLSAAAAVLHVQILNGSSIAASYRAALLTSTGASWSRRSVTFEVQANQTVQILVGLSSTITGTVWADDVQLEKGTGMSAFNLLQNPEFRNGTSGWASANTTVSTENVNQTLLPGFEKQVSFPAASDRQARVSQTFQYKGASGKVFSVGGWIKAASVPLSQKSAVSAVSKIPLLQLQAQLIKSDGSVLQTEYAKYNPCVPDWQFVSFPVRASGEFVRVQISISCDYNVNVVKATGIYCLAEEHGETYAYNSAGNLTSARDLKSSTDAFGYSGNRLSVISTPTGENTLGGYNEGTNALRTALTTNDFRYSFDYNAKGLPTNSYFSSVRFARNAEVGKTYYLVNYDSGRALYARSTTAAGDCATKMWSSGNTDERWTLTATGTTDEYYIKLVGTSFALSVSAAASLTAVKTATFSSGSASQKFKVEKVGTQGLFKITSTISGGACAVDGNPAQTANLTNTTLVKQKTASSYRSQRWYLVEANNSVADQPYIQSATTYDETTNNFVKSTVNTDNKSTAYSYNTVSGLLNSVTDPNSHTTSYTYDAMGRTATVNRGGSGGYNIQYAYTNDRLTQISCLGNVYNVAYDALGRQTTVKVGGSILLSENTYTGYKLTSSKTGGFTTWYDYDAFDRLTEIEYNDLGSQKFYYGANGLTSHTVDTGAGTHTKYAYDLADRLTSATEYATENLSDSGTQVSQVAYGYRGGSNDLSSVTRKAGGVSQAVTLTYGNFANGQKPGFVYSEKLGGAAFLDYAYDALGRMTGKTVAGNQTYAYTYKNFSGGNRTTTQVASLATPDGTYNYTYDNNGNILTETKGGKTTRYAYDGYDRLTREDNQAAGKTYVYTYAGGNIKTRKTYAYTTAANSALGTPQSTDTWTYGDSVWKDRLTDYNGTSIGYPASGQGLFIDWTAVFLSDSGLVMQDNRTGASYSYDARGRRTQKTVGGNTTTYAYAGDLLLKETQPSGATLTFLRSAAGEAVGFRYYNTPYYYVKNLQGDVTALTNYAGTVVAWYRYDAWGRVLGVTALNNDAGYLAIANANPIRYRGYYYDAESGWYYLGSRYYVPEWCRFLTPDALLGANQDIHSYNLYAYCSWDPVNHKDSSGTNIQNATRETLYGYGAGSSQTLNRLIDSISSAAKAVAAFAGGIAGAIVTADVIKKAAESMPRNQSVYVLKDGAGEVQYVGRTKYPKIRANQHRRNPARENLHMEVLFSGLTKWEARGLEEAYMLYYHAININNPMNNQMHGISLNNPFRRVYLQAGEYFLKVLENNVTDEYLNVLEEMGGY